MNIPPQNQNNTNIQIIPPNTLQVLQTQLNNETKFPQSNIFSQIQKQSSIIIGDHEYIKDKCIGKGTFGVVYLLIQNQTQQQYALKIQNQIAQSESDILNKLKQKKFKNLVNTIEFQKNQNSNEYFILMEYCKQSLQDEIDQKKIDSKESRYIIKQIANGIKELHENNIIHRDLKPENILVFEMKDDQTGKIQKTYKICDFGLSSQKEFSQTYKCGTSHYMAPEQIQQMKTNLKHEGYNKSVDIWALGAVIFEIFTGQVLFIAYSKEQIYQEILEISQNILNEKISNKLKDNYGDLIIQMMQKNPEDRIEIENVLQQLSDTKDKATKKTKPTRSFTDQQFQLNINSKNPQIQHPLISPRSQNNPTNKQQQDFINHQQDQQQIPLPQQNNQQFINPQIINQRNNQFPNQQNQFNIDSQHNRTQNFQLKQEHSKQLEQYQINNQNQTINQIPKQNDQSFQQNQQFSKQPQISVHQQQSIQFPQHQNQFPPKQNKDINQEQPDIQNQQITNKITQNFYQQINPPNNIIINQQNQQQHNFQQFQNPVQNLNAFQQTLNNQQQQTSSQKNKQIQQM